MSATVDIAETAKPASASVSAMGTVEIHGFTFGSFSGKASGSATPVFSLSPSADMQEEAVFQATPAEATDTTAPKEPAGSTEQEQPAEPSTAGDSASGSAPAQAQEAPTTAAPSAASSPAPRNTLWVFAADGTQMHFPVEGKLVPMRNGDEVTVHYVAEGSIITITGIDNLTTGEQCRVERKKPVRYLLNRLMLSAVFMLLFTFPLSFTLALLGLPLQEDELTATALLIGLCCGTVWAVKAYARARSYGNAEDAFFLSRTAQGSS